jgi:hypothetical protein
MVSVNTLMNQILTTYARSEHIGAERVLRIPDSLLREILELVPDDKIAEYGKRNALQRGEVGIAIRYGEFNLTNSLRVIADVFQYGGYGTYNERQLARGGLLVTLTHTLGKKYSLMLTGYLKTLFNEVNAEPKITTTDSAVVMEFAYPP